MLTFSLLIYFLRQEHTGVNIKATVNSLDHSLHLITDKSLHRQVAAYTGEDSMAWSCYRKCKTVYSTIVTLHKYTPSKSSVPPSLWTTSLGYKPVTSSWVFTINQWLLLCHAHLSLAVGFHEFDEWRVSFDLELYYRSILTCYLQVYVLVAFCLDCFLRDKAREKKRKLTYACREH